MLLQRLPKLLNNRGDLNKKLALIVPVDLNPCVPCQIRFPCALRLRKNAGNTPDPGIHCVLLSLINLLKDCP